MTRSAKGHSTPAQRSRAAAEARKNCFRSIYELLAAAQEDIEEAVRLARVDVASRIGQVVSEAFEQDAWDRAALVELSTWLVQRGASPELCAPENLARMRRLHELELRVVADDRDAVLSPCHSLIPPEDLEAELAGLDDIHELHLVDGEDPEADDDDDDLFGPAGEDGTRATPAKRH